MPPLPSPYSALLHRAAFAGEEPWLFRSEGWDWRWSSWGELARQAAARAGKLAELPSASRAAFLYIPRPEAIVLDLAIQGAGLVSVPVSGEREIVVLGGPLEQPEERAMLTWATVTGAAVALEPAPGARIATAAWVRPTVFHGTAEEIALLRAWVEKGRRRRRLPFGRLRTVLVAGSELAEEDAAYWRERGVKVGRTPDCRTAA